MESNKLAPYNFKIYHYLNGTFVRESYRGVSKDPNIVQKFCPEDFFTLLNIPWHQGNRWNLQFYRGSGDVKRPTVIDWNRVRIKGCETITQGQLAEIPWAAINLTQRGLGCCVCLKEGATHGSLALGGFFCDPATSHCYEQFSRDHGIITAPTST